MTDTATAHETELANRLEGRLKSLSERLSALNTAVDEGYRAPNKPEKIFETSNGNISDDVNDFKAALEKIRDQRRDFYQQVCAQTREKNFDAADELHRLAEILNGLTTTAVALNAQCEKLDRTRLELKTFSESNTLDETLKNFSENLSKLGTCEKTIRETAAAAATNLDNSQSALDGKISEALDLEREFLITCRELAGTTKNLEQNLNAVADRQLSAVIDAVNALSEKLNGANTTSPANQEREKFFEELFVKINDTVFSDETRSLGAALKNLKKPNEQIPPDVIKPYIEIINRLTKLFSQVRKILYEAGTTLR